MKHKNTYSYIMYGNKTIRTYPKVVAFESCIFSKMFENLSKHDKFVFLGNDGMTRNIWFMIRIFNILTLNIKKILLSFSLKLIQYGIEIKYFR